MTVFGTRPEAIKMAPLVAAVETRPGMRSTVCVTAQHRQMLDQVLHAFRIVPDRDLDLMRPGQTLPELTARVLTEMAPVLRELRPDVVLVQGDTTTAMAAALAAFYEQIPVGHVEAGLRTSNRYYPFPEEINRRLISGLATHHFAPTDAAAAALRAEGIDPGSVVMTGNTVVDALQMILRTTVAPAASVPPSGVRRILMTSHRRENFGEPLRNICRAVAEIATRFEDVEVLYPVHPNPNVVNMVRAELGHIGRVRLVEPLDYVTFVHTLANSFLVLTDSGGVQEEAPFLAKPVLVLRDETERPEGVEAGSARLVGTDPQRIFDAAKSLLEDPAAYREMAQTRSLYGDGRAAARILNVLAECERSVPGKSFMPLAG